MEETGVSCVSQIVLVSEGLGRCWLYNLLVAGKAQILGVTEQRKPQPTEGPSAQCFLWSKQWSRLGFQMAFRVSQQCWRWRGVRQRREGCGIRTISLLPAVHIGDLHDMLEHNRIHELHMAALVFHMAKRSWAEAECSVLLVWLGQWLIVFGMSLLDNVTRFLGTENWVDNTFVAPHFPLCPITVLSSGGGMKWAMRVRSP